VRLAELTLVTSLRVGSLLDVPVSALGHALGEADTFRRAARAAGGRARVLRDGVPIGETALGDASAVLQDRDVVELSGGARFDSPVPGSTAWTVTTEPDGLPVLRAGHGGILGFEITATAAGALTEVAVTLHGGNVRAAAVRRRVLRFGELLLGIALLIAEQTPIVVAGAVVAERDGRPKVLVAQRGPARSGAGRWELPGGKVELGESEQQALTRELREELALQVTVQHRLVVEVPGLPGGAVLRVHRCATDDEPVLIEHTAVRWLAGDELADVDWLDADRVLVPALQELLRR